MRSSTAEAGDRKAAPAPRPSHGPGPPRPHPPHGAQQGPRNYKTLYDKELGAKETIRRYNGHIPGHPKYDVKLPLSDPRNHYIQFRTVVQADLPIPSFTVDRNTVFYPKVEVAMFDLNDNVNKAFLQQLANKIAPPIDIDVFYHPITKKHMGMAMIVFHTFDESRRFVQEYNGKSVMGSQVSCSHDPYFTVLSQRYEDATGEEMRIPTHLRSLEETILNSRRSQYATKHEAMHRGHASSSSLPLMEQSQHMDIEMNSPAISLVEVLHRNLEKRTPRTPCTPRAEVSTPVRKSHSPVRPRTPTTEPPDPPPPPPGVTVQNVVPPPPNSFMPTIPPPIMPPFHPGLHFPEDPVTTLISDGMLDANQNVWINPYYTSLGVLDISNVVEVIPSLSPHFEHESRRYEAELTCRNNVSGLSRRNTRIFNRGYSGFENYDNRPRRRCSPHLDDYLACDRRRPFSRFGRSRWNYKRLCSRKNEEKRRQNCIHENRRKRNHDCEDRMRNCNLRRTSDPYRRDGLIVKRYRYDRSSPRYSARGNYKNGDQEDMLKPSPPPRKKTRWDDPGNVDLCVSQAQPGPSNAQVPPMPPIPPLYGIPYPPPPPYSALPTDGSAVFPPGYLHPNLAAPVAGPSTPHEKAKSSPLEEPQESRRGKRGSRNRPHKKRKKKRRKHSSDSSSSSSSSSSLNVGEYLRVEKKEMSTKYISREREGREKTIVEEIKTITKRKKYMVTEPKRTDVKPTTGLQKISSDESEEKVEVVQKEVKEKASSPSKVSEKEKKMEGHRWSSSSTESDIEFGRKREKKNDKTLSASSSLQDLSSRASRTPVPPIVAPPPPPPADVFSPGRPPAPQRAASVAAPTLPPPPPPAQAVTMTPLPIPGPNICLPPTHLLPPPPHFPLPPMNPGMPLGAPGFNPMLPPPPGFCPPPSQTYIKRDLPKVTLRFVEESLPHQATQAGPSQQTLADRVASIFGADTVGGASACGRSGSSASQREGSLDAVCDDVDDMDVDVGSSMSPPPDESMSVSPIESQRKDSYERRRTRRRSADKQKKQFVRNVAVVCEATERTIGEEIVDVVTKDFYKRVETVSFEILEEVLAELRAELEEQKRNEAKEALRAQAQMDTPEKPSDVSQFCDPIVSLNSTPEKLVGFPFTFNMPKLPSFRRKVRAPSPESDSESRSPLITKRSDSSDDSDAAHKSSSSRKSSGSSDEVVVRRKKRAQRYRSSSSVSGSESSSELSSCESERTSTSSHSKSRKSSQGKDSSSVAISSVVSSASSIASSPESSASSDDDQEEAELLERDASTATEEEHKPEIVVELKPEPEKIIVETPLWQRLLGDNSQDWSESLSRSLYHVNLTEHCYFKLLEDEKKDEEPTPVVVKEEIVAKEDKVNKEKKCVTPQKRPKKEKLGRELLSLLPSVDVRPILKSEITYPPWSAEDKLRHIFNWDCCFDPEDQEYLKKVWLELQPSGENAPPPPWKRPVRFNFASWANKPRLLDTPKKRGRVDQFYEDDTLDGIIPIQDGCARTRGYFKLSAKEKRSLIRRPEDEIRDLTVINDRDEAAVRHNLVVTKESRSMHRRLLTTMGDAHTDLFKVNQLKYRKKMIKFARSRIHGWGLYAMETIAPDDMIVEYVGQKVRNTVADVREKAYERRGIGSSYLFRIDDTTVIDATRMGNFARFINHSCQPNCYAKVVTVEGDKRIVIYSKTLINKGDEITYDYKFPIEDDKVDCLCGAPNCRGTLN